MCEGGIVPEATIHIGDCIESMHKMPAGSVHCCVTSPPFWGLRDYGTDGQYGLEATPEEYVAKMVDTFREVKRVLRNDGTLWLNLGDSYARDQRKGGSGPGGKHDFIPDYGNARRIMSESLGSFDGVVGRANRAPVRVGGEGLKPKDLVGIPWAVAFALRADGWYLRSDIIWSKMNPMPESVTDRPTKAHEYIFLLSKSSRYYYDHEAIKEPDGGRPAGNVDGFRNRQGLASFHVTSGGPGSDGWEPGGGRNKRSVWAVSTTPFPEAHFAVYPSALIEPCILAGTSEKGCCADCGAPWERVVERSGEWRAQHEREQKHDGTIYRRNPGGGLKGASTTTEERTTGWKPTCSCDADTVPCTVLDPFGGAGTTALVALKRGRNAILCEINPTYAEMARARIRNDAPIFNTVHVAA